MGDIELTKL